MNTANHFQYVIHMLYNFGLRWSLPVTSWLFDKFRSLTGSGRLTHKGHQLLFDLLKGVQVVHEEDVSVAGFTGDAHQLPVVGVSEADGKHNVTFTGRQRGKKTVLQHGNDQRRNVDENFFSKYEATSRFVLECIILCEYYEC